MASPVSIAFIDGGGNVTPQGGDKVLAIIATCTALPANTPTVYGGSNTAALKAACGYGKLLGISAEVANVPNHGPIVLCNPSSTAGTSSAVTQVGTGPVVTTTGNGIDEFEVVLKVVDGGALGTGTGVWSLDGGRTWSPKTTLAASMVLQDSTIVSGLTLSLAAGTYVAGTTYSFTTTGPTVDATQLATALDAIKAASGIIQPSWIHVAVTPQGATDANRSTAAATLAATCSSKADGFATSNKFLGISLEAAPAVDASTAANRTTWRSALASAFAAFTSIRTMVGAGHGRVQSVVDQRKLKRSFAGLGICIKQATAPTNQSFGYVGAGPLPSNFDATTLEHNEAEESGLEAARFCATTLHGDQKPGVYLKSGMTMGTPGSDYERVETLRVANASAQALNTGLLAFVEKDLATLPNGKLDPREANNIDKVLTDQQLDLQRGKVSAIAVKVDRDANYASTKTLTAELSFRPRPAARAIVATISVSKGT